MTELEEFLLKRNQALNTLDLKWARTLLPMASDDTLLAALHKTRHHCTAIAPELRIASARWLKERGRTSMYGLPIDDPTILPE